LEAPGNFVKHRIARPMAPGIVDRFEMVQVEEK
jgi:hypothetical protein